MKKFFVLSLIALMVLGFGTMAYAQAKKEEPKLDFKASGFIDIQSFYYKNIPADANTSPAVWSLVPIFGPPGGAAFLPTTGDPRAYNRKLSYMDSRARLKFDAVYGKELSGTIFLEMDSHRWGDRLGAHAGVIGERNTMGYWSGDRASVEIKNVYFDFAIPAIIPVPITVRAGLQPLSVRPKMTVYTDGMGVSVGIKVDPVTLNPLWFKAIENKDYAADDVDVYGLTASAKIGGITVGGYGLYYKMGTYPLFAVSVFAAPPMASLIFGTMKADAYWLGVYADGKVGPVNMSFDFVYDRGEVESRLTPTAKDVKYRGWAARGSIDYPWEKFNFGFVGMYATGADKKKTSADGLPGTTDAYGLNTPTRKVGSYVTPPGSEAFAVFGEGLVFYPNFILSSDHGFYTPNYYSMGRGAIGGTWMAKAYASFKATPWYKVTVQGMYIGDTTKNGNTIGTAVKPNGFLRDDKDIGWEFGLINEINIYKNLKLDIAGGILFAGDALDYRYGTTNTNKSPSNPWSIGTRLAYTF